MPNSVSRQHRSLYAAIADGGSGRDVAAMLYRLADAFRFSHATLFLMPSKTDRELWPLVLESSFSREYWQQMVEACPLPTCAIFNAARGSILPIEWSVEKLLRQSRLLNQPEPPVLELYRQYKLSRGILFPLSSLDGTRHVIRFDGDRGQLGQPEINDFWMLALHFFQAYDRGRYPLCDNPCGLTEREIEVVRWTAAGKTSGEIATAMSLSDHTINGYMNNALKKLDCTKRAHLVAKALRMRIIS